MMNPRKISPIQLQHTLIVSLYHTLFFSTRTQQLFDTQKFNVNEMLFEIHLKGMQLDAEYEMAGESIDDINA